jgi:hypothetical protein
MYASGHMNQQLAVDLQVSLPDNLAGRFNQTTDGALQKKGWQVLAISAPVSCAVSGRRCDVAASLLPPA